MGNTQTPDGADHHHYYRRPADGVEPERSMQEPSVQIVDDGAAPGGGLRARPEGASVSDARDESPHGFPMQPRKRINYYFAAAWAMVGVLLALGLSWLGGMFSVDQQYFAAPGMPTEDMPSAIVMNLYSMGPTPFLLGLFGAFTLLVVQGAAFRRNAKT
ncbi:MAG: hypothetical protein ABTA24_16415 [Arthrobacter sp.]